MQRMGEEMPWKKTGFVREDDTSEPADVRVYAIGGDVAALIVDVAGDDTLIDRLRRELVGIRKVAESPDVTAEQLQPVVDRLDATLSVVTAARPELQEKCARLSESLERFLHPERFDPLGERDASDDNGDVPY